MLHTKFQASEPSSSGEDYSAAGPFLTPGPPFVQTW